MNADEKAAAVAATRLLEARQQAVTDTMKQLMDCFTGIEMRPGLFTAFETALFVAVGAGFDAGVKAVAHEPISAPRPAKFIIYRPQFPYWWTGWNEYNLPSWSSDRGDSYLVPCDELVETLKRLEKHKPIAALHSPTS